jgi:hypothetical protein
MSRKSFDDGHQNAGHVSGGTVDFDVMHNLFHGHRTPGGTPTGPRGDEHRRPAPPTGGVVPEAETLPDEGYYDEDEPPTQYELYLREDREGTVGDLDDLGDLVDPQNDTYEEEGTHGVPLAIGAAAKAYGKFRKTPAGKAVEAKAIEKGTEIAGKAMVAAKDKLKGKGGAGLASPDSEGVGTPDSDDPFA